jgi:putative MATE family efflux protein
MRVSRRSRYDREIFRLALPALGALAIEPLYVLVDTAIVGRLGTDPLAGLAVAAAVLTSAFALCNFLAYGTTAAVARLIGAGDERRAAAQGVDALWLGLAIGSVIALLGLVLAGPIVDVMGASSDVRPYALTYLRISMLGTPAVMLALAGMGYLRGRQDTRTPLYVALGANVANLVIEIVLVYGLDLGIAGSAWGTVIVQVGAAVVFVSFVTRAARAHDAPLTPDAPGIRRAARVGGQLVVRTGALLAGFLTATAVAGRIGDAELAAHQVAFQLWLFLALSLDAIAIAAQAMLGRYLGAGDAATARSASARMVQWGVAAGVVLGTAVIVLRPFLAVAFTDDSTVQELLRDVLWIVALTQPLNAVVFVLDGVLIGAGETRYLALAMLAAFAAYLPAALLVLASGAGLIALWLALTWFMAVRTAGMGARYVTDRWLVTGASRA